MENYVMSNYGIINKNLGKLQYSYLEQLRYYIKTQIMYSQSWIQILHFQVYIFKRKKKYFQYDKWQNCHLFECLRLDVLLNATLHIGCQKCKVQPLINKPLLSPSKRPPPLPLANKKKKKREENVYHFLMEHHSKFCPLPS